MTRTTRPAALGHTCVRQEAPGAPLCGSLASVDEVDGAIVRPYCEAHEAEADCRYFAAEFPTPNVLEAVRLCETGRLRWTQVQELFRRSLAAGLASV